MNLYIYYRVADTAAARPVIQQLMQDIVDRAGLKGRLLSKCDDMATWMEIYEGIDNRHTFIQLMAELETKRRVDTFLLPGSQRHQEWFDTF